MEPLDTIKHRALHMAHGEGAIDDADWKRLDRVFDLAREVVESSLTNSAGEQTVDGSKLDELREALTP